MFLFILGVVLLGAGVWAVLKAVKQLRKNELIERAPIIERGKYGAPDREIPREPAKAFGWLSTSLYGGLGLIAVVFGGIFFWNSVTYTQDPGQAIVEKDIFGNFVGQSNDTGLHLKGPWVDTVEFNVRNQPVAFGTPVNGAQEGAAYTFDGPQITVRTSDGVDVNQDIQVVYSVNGAKVTEIWQDWKTEEAFKNSFVFQDIRNTVREQGNQRTTNALLTDLTDFGGDVEKALREKWEGTGVVLESVNLQEPRPPQSVSDAYAAANAAKINVTTQENNLAAAKISTQTRIAEADADAQAAIKRAAGEAESNRLINASLTDSILQKLLIDAYDEGTVFVTDGNSPILLNAR